MELGFGRISDDSGFAELEKQPRSPGCALRTASEFPQRRVLVTDWLQEARLTIAAQVDNLPHNGS